MTRKDEEKGSDGIGTRVFWIGSSKPQPLPEHSSINSERALVELLIVSKAKNLNEDII